MISFSRQKRPPQIAIISEVSVGYGTPQVIRVADSLAREWGADVTIFEPDQPERPPVDLARHAQSAKVTVQRIYTSSHPYSTAGRIEFCLAVASAVKELAPLAVVVCASYGLPVLYHIDTSRSVNVFYCLEHVPEKRDPSLELVAKHCQVVVFPERNRARLYTPRLGGPTHGQQIVVVMNANFRRATPTASEKVPRIFYGGSFHREMTFAEYFLSPEMSQFPIDVYGIIDGFPDRKAIARQMHGNQGGIRYCGYLEADEAYFQTLSQYQYSLVIWNPSNEAQFYAAPNKLFDAIACGVPPLCAPHPQCKEIVSRWACGLVTDDWSAESLRVGLSRACGTFGTPFYKTLSSNCQKAMEQGLDWDSQCEELIQAMRKYLIEKR